VIEMVSITLELLGESEANTIAHHLNVAGITTLVERHYHAGHAELPTQWWHVNVPKNHLVTANTWLSGWRAGCDWMQRCR
jgi:hypothetical protein